MEFYMQYVRLLRVSRPLGLKKECEFHRTRYIHCSTCTRCGSVHIWLPLPAGGGGARVRFSRNYRSCPVSKLVRFPAQKLVTPLTIKRSQLARKLSGDMKAIIDALWTIHSCTLRRG
ncbi:hypothetical protein EVAR_18746_1 [Eumeta japonica]|uniref:Uncharacterized protein n=1 Tax=Eumeta variegata TaxID=151549 RepID=A0A4C1UNK7_EUMVA|nr:hypothetical protein EVAR_18746_1 [Eumeta japonica]